GGYAEGAAAGAPAAVQVADRWHLMHNLSEAVRRVAAAHRRCLRTPSAAPATSGDPPPANDDQPAVVEGRRADNTRSRHTAVHQLLGHGLELKAISRQLQMNVKTVR